MSHPIRRYCDLHGITQAEFARTVGLSDGFVSQLIRGHEKCGRDAALTIVSKTGGAVRLEELLTWEPTAPSRAAS